VSYGSDFSESFGLLGNYVARILKGEKPADLSIVQPTKFDFAINLKTAKALGLSIPETLLATAGKVVEYYCKDAKRKGKYPNTNKKSRNAKHWTAGGGQWARTRP
jgi:ABC transporter substrate binding protein